MLDQSKSIAEFTGEEGPNEAKNWLSQFETTSTLHSWPPAFAFETAKTEIDTVTQLTGLADLLFKIMSHAIASFHQKSPTPINIF